MPRLALPLLLLATAVAAPLGAQTAIPTAPVYERAAALVRDGGGEEGRRLVDSMFVAARPGSPEHAEALFWRASLATSATQAERDYRQLVVEHPLSPRADRALLALAQLELARNDRERALAHLTRIAREYPSGPSRAAAAFWTARVRFDQGDEPRACTALDDARRLTPAGDVELRNQVEYYADRCVGVQRVAEGDARLAVGSGRLADTAVTTRPPTTSANPALPPRRAAPPVGAEPRDPPVSSPPTANRQPPTRFSIQIAAYDTRADAEALVARLARRNVEARVVGTARPFRVRTGAHATRAAAVAAQRELRARSIIGIVVEDAPPAGPAAP